MNAPFGLDDRYRLPHGPILISGTQALVRLLIEQAWADRARGIRTAGYVSGYRGSPLGGLDTELWRAKSHLAPLEIFFQPGLNEDLAATAVWGSQQANAIGQGRHDGVFGLWYGKGPGVDRSGDALKHANAWGTSPHGGVVAVAGDDHGAKSSSLAHQSEPALIDARMPVLHPADVADIVTLGRYGIALSRFAGLWTGLKVTAAVMDSAAIVTRPTDDADWILPTTDGLSGMPHLRWPDDPVAQERRLIEVKLPAALAFLRSNPLNYIANFSGRDRIAILGVGKAWNDVCAALELLGLDAAALRALGIRLGKVVAIWPADPDRLIDLIGPATTVLVVEEKRALIERQVKEALFDRAAGRSVRVFGKAGPLPLPETGELEPLQIARAIRVILGDDPRLRPLPELPSQAASSARTPYFCAGCPHNSSTRLPDGSIALGGIGCHSMAMSMDRGTIAYAQMGGEGATWIGQAPFSTTKHVFQNLGDGTFYHSGSLGIRAAVAAGVNITFKILFNDAVAMTGGQPVEGELTVARIVSLLRAEGVGRIVVLANDPSRHRALARDDGVTVDHRDALDRVQRSLRDTPGVSALIFDQACAAELRRRRKRGKAPRPKTRVYINPDICEGCGDCGIQSNCVAVQPLSTPFGTKRRIDQAACNVDLSCLKGFCPSFVTIDGAPNADGPLQPSVTPPLPEPVVPAITGAYRIMIAGIGGTGIVTVGALLMAAARIEGKAAASYDMTGMAQKGGAVVSHVALANEAAMITATAAPTASARLLIGCDPLVAAAHDVLARLDPVAGAAIWEVEAAATGAFTRKPNDAPATEPLDTAIRARVAPGMDWRLAARRVAEEGLGSAAGANLVLLGFAWQQGLVPLQRVSIEAAIRANAVAVDANIAAFALGRALVLSPAPVDPGVHLLEPIDALIERHAVRLTAYQDAVYAARYRATIGDVRASEARVAPDTSALTRAVAENLGRLMTYKDEYEVARLWTAGDFLNRLPKGRRRFHLAPPLLPGTDPFHPDRPRKRVFGAGTLQLFRILASLRRVRGTAFDPFGYGAERRRERALASDYAALAGRIAEGLTPQNYDAAVALARWPDQIRGFGPVKAAAIDVAQEARSALEADFACAMTREMAA